MALSYKILGQLNPSANSITTLYTVPASTQTIVSTLSVCNLSSNAVAYSVAIKQANATLANSQYIAYSTPVAGADSIVLTLGLTLNSTDVVAVSANTASVSFNLFGSEIS